MHISFSQLARGGFYLLALFLFCLSYWIHRYFGDPDIGQIAYHLQFGVELVRSSDPVFTRRFIRWCVLAPLLFLALLWLAESRLPAAGAPWLRRLHRFFPQLLLAAAALFWLCDLSALKYAGARFGPDYFGAHYVRPDPAALKAKAPKNLILIYVESLEAGYADRAAFGRDLLAPLGGLRAASFPVYAQAPGTGWTIAAMVATQCGVPLERVTLFDGNTQGQVMDSFLKRAVCLPDLLAAQGYRNVFLGGASTGFAGKDKFLRQHHYHEILGREEWLRQGAAAGAMNGWGLNDADLFRQARRKLGELAASRQRFNLTLLTSDMHEPGNYLSPDCARQGFAAFAGVVACTAREAAAFVEHVRQSGLMESTSIVIVGDHLARKNPLSARLERQARRSIFNAFIAREAPRPNREQLLHFDLLPTILEFSGFEVPQGRLGLGYSGFGVHEDRPPPGRLRDMERDLLNRSGEYLALWSDAGL
ncbi:sulfatase-like hydrolase/transferase [Massilia endophytica]|uniref:sulfatase-like hydrolase/transferase n=1 Tax=Massilia endophytica TaxID=2899220 RepID=UPI001E5C7CC5|nr:sulfatase-like hydrolase/transferase [Massilia endophytica]UGQ47344.1 sulfatase-like hydrolase/transferase [Massilia endophytica]